VVLKKIFPERRPVQFRTGRKSSSSSGGPFLGGQKIFKKKILSFDDSVGKYLGPRTTIPLTKNKKDLKEVLQSLFRQPTTPIKNFFADRKSEGTRKNFFRLWGNPIVILWILVDSLCVSYKDGSKRPMLQGKIPELHQDLGKVALSSFINGPFFPGIN
jgi:hypothetical protein